MLNYKVIIKAGSFEYFVEYSAMENLNFSCYFIIKSQKNKVDCFALFL